VLIGDELTFLLRHRLPERRGRGQELREPAGELAVEGEGLTSEFREAQGDRARGDAQLPRSTADTRRVHREAKQTVKAHAAFGVVVDAESGRAEPAVAQPALKALDTPA
jgi:hypothetical protein